MPRTLFDQTLVPPAKNARPIGTLSLSILLHAGALAVILALQFTSSIQGLLVASPLEVFVVPPTPPRVATPPPPVRPATPSQALDPRVAPTVASDTIPAEPELTGPPPAPGPPSSLTMGPPGAPGAILPGGRDITLSDTPPQRPSPSPLRVGGTVLPPARVVYVPPVYPTLAQTARVEGEVVLEATIDETGAVRDVIVRTSIPLLDRAAVDAVSKWRYLPTRLNGQPVPVIMLVRVKFSLK